LSDILSYIPDRMKYGTLITLHKGGKNELTTLTIIGP